MESLDRFRAPTAEWFRSSFAAPTKAQVEGWEAIGSGAHSLIHAPTGSGKTLAAFLWTIDRLFAEPLPEREARCRVLYVSPMKALAHDIDRNLRAPLAGIRHAAARTGHGELPPLATFVRTGDTPEAERRRMRSHPPDILITTPESLHLVLTSQARTVLESVRWVIVDEVHAVAGTKRGAHLALSLERLEDTRHAAGAERAMQRIGLSATQRPVETMATFLGGGQVAPGAGSEAEWQPRPVVVVDAAETPRLDLELTVPVEDMTAPPEQAYDPAEPSPSEQAYDPAEPAERAEPARPATPAPSEPAPAEPPAPAGRVRPGLWSAIQPRILQLIRAHTSTIVFVNSRRLAERLSGELNDLAGEELTRAHHGSVSRAQRVQIEEALKGGTVRAVVATSSLELGIDMGAVDRVIQVEAPISVASGLQRVGRAGHQVFEVSRATLIPKHRGDLLVSTVVARLMTEGAVEATHIPRHPLDVLAQQIVASVVASERHVDELYAMVRRAAPYGELPRSAFESTLDMLAGKFPSDEFAELRPRVVWDRLAGTVRARPGARMLAITNAGTIPDRGMYRVALPDGSRVGELDEEMVYESRQGDVFVLGSSTWRIAEIGTDTVTVTPAPGEPAAAMPFWHGDQAGRPVDTGRAIGGFIREIDALDHDEASRRLREHYRLDEFAAGNLLAYLAEERDATGVLPSDRTVVVQRFRDEIGDWRVLLLSPLGARVHAPWAMALTQRLRARGYDVDVVFSDDGIALRFPDADEIPSAAELELGPDDVRDLLVEHLADTALFAARFREAAGRSLLLPRRRPGNRTPLWLQRRRAANLLATAREFGSFPIVLECYREILQDDFDVPALVEVLGDIEARRVRVVDVELAQASPFASSLLYAFVAAFLYEADTPVAERRAMALTLDRELLAELLGEAELAELLSAEVIAAVTAEVQRRTAERATRDAEDVADLLRVLGPLSTEDVAARAAEPGEVARQLETLVTQRRVYRVRIGGEQRFAVAEDIARLRDALGVVPPQGVPDALLEPVEDPLGDVIGRYARTHGPFSAEAAAAELTLPTAVVETTLQSLERAGRVVRGTFDRGGQREGGGQLEWVDADVLRRIKRGSLAELRGEIEPVEPAALGAFLPRWHGICPDPPGGGDAVLDAVARLQGAPMPASVLERVLAERVREPAATLDALMADGTLVWIGHGSLGSRDGKVALYFRDQVHRLAVASEHDPPDSARHTAILAQLAERGASFFAELRRACGAAVDGSAVHGSAVHGSGADSSGDRECLDALWDLVWAGLVTNDTLAPLRALSERRARRSAAANPRRRTPTPPQAAGRWSLVAELLDPELTRTEFVAAWTEQLLHRHGVLTRATVAAENVPGGFHGLYPVLSRLEETGQVRRGYFVEGLGGAQFAEPGAVSRLRGASQQAGSGGRGPDEAGSGGQGSDGQAGALLALAATDPANPYGATLEWPELPGTRLARVAGAHVLLADGKLVAFVERGGKTVRRLDIDPALEALIAAALAGLARREPRYTITTVDGASVTGSSLATALAEHGFAHTPQGMRWRHRAGR